MVDDNLEQLLKARRVPEPRSNLEQRIIDMAARGAQEEARERISLRGLWTSFWDGFLLPSPALSMALVLGIGILVGIETTDLTVNTNQVDIVSYLDVGSSADYGGWL